MATNHNNGRMVKTTGTVFDIIEIIAENEELRLTEIADELGLANSTVHSHLKALSSRGYVVKKGRGFELSLRFFELGENLRNQSSLFHAAHNPIQDLANETNEIAWLFVREGGEAVILEGVRGDRAVPTVGRIGRRDPINCPAAGKAMLAHLPRDDVMAIIDTYGLPQQTPYSITDPAGLLDELETIRERGYALNDQESTEGLRAVGSAVVSEGVVQGAVSVAGPARRLTGDYYRDELPQKVMGAANAIELTLRE